MNELDSAERLTAPISLPPWNAAPATRTSLPASDHLGWARCSTCRGGERRRTGRRLDNAPCVVEPPDQEWVIEVGLVERVTAGPGDQLMQFSRKAPLRV